MNEAEGGALWLLDKPPADAGEPGCQNDHEDHAPQPPGKRRIVVVGRAFWADVLEFWGAMKAMQPHEGGKVHVKYGEFLKEVAAFEEITFAERLYPQYERFRDTGEIPQDPLLESWAANRLAGAVARMA